MQTATSETEIKFRDLSICVHHYTLRAPCPKGQGTGPSVQALFLMRRVETDVQGVSKSNGPCKNGAAKVKLCHGTTRRTLVTPVLIGAWMANFQLLDGGLRSIYRLIEHSIL